MCSAAGKSKLNLKPVLVCCGLGNNNKGHVFAFRPRILRTRETLTTIITMAFTVLVRDLILVRERERERERR